MKDLTPLAATPWAGLQALAEPGGAWPWPSALDPSAAGRPLALTLQALERHRARAMRDGRARAEKAQADGGAIAQATAALRGPAAVWEAYAAYIRDAAERGALTLEALRQRGDGFLAHEEAGAPPVLIYDYDVVVDGADLPRPSNYLLLRIIPPQGVVSHAWKRPYVIIDPRAGHGPGIGGFKTDSQVGVALRDGHPVYFVAFRQKPVPGQTLADVTYAEATFLRKIDQEFHPEAPKPVIVGNCQGGWATAVLAATNPDLTGPIVLNGAPMSYWSGAIGQDPMRYTGGMLGGALPALVAADMGGGLFDGADLVQNFEALNPGRTWFRKYYDLFDRIDDGADRFLQFEKWWGGFFLMTDREIRWIVENLFVGNRLARNLAQLEPGLPVDLKAIKAPVIVFASYGDNITPPQQALNWIVDAYSSSEEIEIRGQRILYMVHEEVGHLGIFVSSQVAKKEHSEVASTLKTIEALPPGLYEMKIEDSAGEGHARTFEVSFHRRHLSDLATLAGTRDEEGAFAAVARMSEAAVEAYEATARPVVQAAHAGPVGAMRRRLNPMRAQRAAISSLNPVLAPAIASAAEHARSNRTPVAPDNPFRLAERLWADMVEQQWNLWRDWHAASTEALFLGLYAHPFAVWYGAPNASPRARDAKESLRGLPEARGAVARIGQGGLAEAVVRMLVLLAATRQDVRKDRLERSSALLSTQPPFSEIEAAERAHMIHEQTLIAHFEPRRGLKALPRLLPSPEDRQTALDMVAFVLGAPAEMEPKTAALLAKMRALLAPPAPAAAREEIA